MSNMPLAKKSLGQHWLADKPSLQAMVAAAHVQAKDVVLEIGPGTGTLTDELLACGAEVVALEYDQQLADRLEKKYRGRPANQILIQRGDIRTYDLANLPESYKIVANIPYYLTANLMRKLVDDSHKPSVAALLVQKEVAERIASAAGHLTQIAVFTQVFYEVSLGTSIPAYLFAPPPKVDSQIVVLKRRAHPLFVADKTFFTVVTAGFSQRRKKLKSSLAAGLALDKSETEALLAQAQIDPNLRAQELSLQDWHTLTELIRNNTPLP